MSQALSLGAVPANAVKKANAAGHGGAMRVALIAAGTPVTRFSCCHSAIAAQRESLRRSRLNGMRPDFWKRWVVQTLGDRLELCVSQALSLGAVPANAVKKANAAGHGGAMRVALIAAGTPVTRFSCCHSAIAAQRESLRRSRLNGMRPEFWKR
ncbi:MAG: hypothetical protein R3E01_03645 [Pirellulaceae bacterium]